MISISISPVHFEFTRKNTMFFAKSLFVQSRLRGYQFIINELTLSQILYQLNIHFTNSYWIIVCFSNTLRIYFLYRELNFYIANSLWIHYELIICFAAMTHGDSLWIGYRITYYVTIIKGFMTWWLCITK